MSSVALGQVTLTLHTGVFVCPIAYNSCILDALSQVVVSCILDGVHVSFIAMRMTSSTLIITDLELWKHFALLSRKCSKINLKFSAEKSDVELNWGSIPEEFTISLDKVSVNPKLKIHYTGLPVGDSL